MQGRGGVLLCLSARRRNVSACSHQIPLWHELCSHSRICLSTWPDAIGSELPVAQAPTTPNLFIFFLSVLPSFCLCKLYKCKGSIGEVHSTDLFLTRVVSSEYKPTIPPLCALVHFTHTVCNLNAFLTRGFHGSRARHSRLHGVEGSAH